MAFQNTFNFVGQLRFGKEPAKDTTFNSGATKRELKASLQESPNNGVYLALEGWVNEKPIKTRSKTVFGEQGSNIEIPFTDRLNPEIVNTVADFRKTVVDLTIDPEVKQKYYTLRSEIYNLEQKTEATKEDYEKLSSLYKQVAEEVPHRKEFISPLDAVNFLASIADKVKDKRFRVTGNVEVSHWNGKFYTNYRPTKFEIVTDEEVKNQLVVNADLYFTKKGMDESGFKKDKVITFNTYLSAWDSARQATNFYPYPTMFNAKNHDMENPKHVAHIEAIKKFLSPKSKNVHHLTFEVRLVQGAEEKEFSINDLTDEQKTLVDLGLATAESFNTGRTFGDRVSENRIYIPILKDFGDNGNFKSGAVETALTEDDLRYIATEQNQPPVKSEPTNDTGSKTVDFDEDMLPF